MKLKQDLTKDKDPQTIKTLLDFKKHQNINGNGYRHSKIPEKINLKDNIQQITDKKNIQGYSNQHTKQNNQISQRTTQYGQLNKKYTTSPSIFENFRK